MARFMERFWDDDAGSRTVDWIVLAAGALLLGTALVASLAPGDRSLVRGAEGPVLTGEV